MIENTCKPGRQSSHTDVSVYIKASEERQHEGASFISAHLCSAVYATIQHMWGQNPGVPIGRKPLGKHESARRGTAYQRPRGHCGAGV